MASAFLRRQNLGICQNFLSSSAPNRFIYSKNNHCWQQNGPYSRWSSFFRRDAKAVDMPATPFVFGSSSSSSSSSSSFSAFGFVGWYLGMVKSRPIVTKSVTCSLIYIAADLTSQAIGLPSTESYDLVRTLRMAGYGMVILGPSLHYWFNLVSRILPGRDIITTMKKMALGQTVYGPCMTVLFFSLNAALQGEDADEIMARLKRDLLPTMLNGVMYWPLCDFVTFKFVPVYLQPLVSNSFSYLWTVYMTYMASLEKATAA
uniref:Uncharacterized protein n=1 Tax=Opuntia streptacantha TaxID=393608 RepID=A0A7C8Z4S4_OPUST